MQAWRLGERAHGALHRPSAEWNRPGTEGLAQYRGPPEALGDEVENAIQGLLNSFTRPPRRLAPGEKGSVEEGLVRMAEQRLLRLKCGSAPDGGGPIAPHLRRCQWRPDSSLLSLVSSL